MAIRILSLCLILCCAFNASAWQDDFHWLNFKVGVNSTNTNIKANTMNDATQPGGSLTNFAAYKYHRFKTVSAASLEYWQNISDSFVIGVEATDMFGRINVNRDSYVFVTAGLLLTDNLNVAIKNSLAILAKPGFKCDSNTIVYALIGPRLSWINVLTSSNYINSNGISLAGNTTAEQSFAKMGLSLGAGLEYYIGKNFMLGFEYTYTNYGGLSLMRATTPIIDEDTGLEAGTLTNTINALYLNTSSIGLSIAYKIF